MTQLEQLKRSICPEAAVITTSPIVDRGDQTRQLDAVGAVAIEDQDISVQDNVPTFFWEFLTNPISLVLSVAVILLLLNQTRSG